MRGSPIAFDGLWRCLCPGLDRLVLRQGVESSRPLARKVAQRTAQSSAACLRLPERRLITTHSSSETWETSDTSDTSDTSETGTSTWTSFTRNTTPKNGVPRDEHLLAPTPPTEETLRRASPDDIMSALLTMRQPRGWHFHGQEIDRHSRIILLVRHMLSERGQRPSPFIYECMMDAMVEPQGLAKGIRKLLDDMASQNIKPTSDMCQSALAALANHPDYTLRQEILGIMHEFWFTIDTRAKQSVLLGLLRDEQYELAYLRLTEMMDKKALIDIWVYDIFIMVFGKLGFIDEMLLLLFRRRSLESEGKAISSILYYVLDVASQAFHYPGTMFAWNSVVRTSLFQPSDGIAENVLATAARHGDASLATEALDKISQRTRLLPYHYEAVVEALAANGDVAGAFRTLCIMKRNGIRIARGNTRAVHEALRRHPTLIPDAEQGLRDLASSEQHVPVAAAGVVVEALAEKQGAEAAMALYREVPVLCGEQANAAMMQTLIMNSNSAETTRSLARDYTSHVAEDDDPVRSAHVYKALIMACAEAGELDLAFRFANQAVTQARGDRGGSVKEKISWAKVLLGKAVEVEDARIWAVVDELGKDEETGRELARVLRQMRITRRAAGLGGR